MKLKSNTVDEEEEDEEEEERRKKRERREIDSSVIRQEVSANESIGVESNAKDNRLAIALVADDLNPPSLGASDAERETARGQHTGGRGT